MKQGLGIIEDRRRRLAVRTSIARQAIDSHLMSRWLPQAAISMPPVVLLSCLCCNYERPGLLVGLFAAEWLLVLTAWRLLCPWLGHRIVAVAAVPFMASVFIAAIVTSETMAIQGMVWNWSDDLYYLTEAERVVQSLRSSGWNLHEAWSDVGLSRPGAWTLAGWPFVLGVVGSLVTSETSPELLHAVALSLNATSLALVLALVYHVLPAATRQSFRAVLLCYLLMIGDPIVYAGQALKESMLQLSLMLAFASCINLSNGMRLKWGILGACGFLGVTTMRTAYVPLLVLVLYWTMLDRMRLTALAKGLLGVLIAIAFAGAVLRFQVRENAIGELIQMHSLQAEDGLGMRIYSIPLVGPVIFYAMSPAPALPWEILSSREVVTTLIRSAGSIAWFCSASYVLYGLAMNWHLLQNRLFAATAIMFVGTFSAVVLAADDPRYKQPTNFFLSIMLFLVWWTAQQRCRHPQQVTRPSRVSNATLGIKLEKECR